MTDKQMHSKNLSVELDKSRTTATSLIIDGVNVRECKYFNKYQKIVRNNEVVVDIKNACIEEIKTKPCSQKHNCYFKNWQRKEQECEKAKRNAQDTYELYQALIESFNILQGEKINLEQENEELKDKLNCCFCNPHVELNDTEKLRKCLEITECFRRQFDQLEAENENLKKEVRILKSNRLNMFEHLDIVQENKKLEQTLAEIKEIITTALEQNTLINLDKILQKINEVKNEKNNS